MLGHEFGVVAGRGTFGVSLGGTRLGTLFLEGSEIRGRSRSRREIVEGTKGAGGGRWRKLGNMGLGSLGEEEGIWEVKGEFPHDREEN